MSSLMMSRSCNARIANNYQSIGGTSRCLLQRINVCAGTARSDTEMQQVLARLFMVKRVALAISEKAKWWHCLAGSTVMQPSSNKC